MMKFAKKTACLMLVMFMLVGLFSEYTQVQAKELSLPTPKISVKLVSNKTGAKLTVGKTKDAEGYHILLTGKTINSDFCPYIKYKNEDGEMIVETELHRYINKNGKKKRSYTFKDLQPGTYTVKVQSYNNKKYGNPSEWSKEITFTLKEADTKGYTTSYDFSKVKKGDVVKFGAYEQDLDYTNGKEPIEWIVLSKTKNSVLLLSKYALDRMPYNKYRGEITWETCTLREWLNTSFINSAFNKTEQKMIKSSTIENYDNAVYKSTGGNDTEDKVFLLSQLEAINTDFGFSDNYEDDDISRRCAFAWYKNTKGGSLGTADGEKTCSWWLRTPGMKDEYACTVWSGNVISRGENTSNIGINSDYGQNGVRPAIYISLK